MTTQQGWTGNGITYYHAKRPDNLGDLQPGVYEYRPSTMATPWSLEFTKDCFEVPADAIELHSQRQQLLLKNAKSNRSFGAILTGIRGTGKTFLMKIVANELINQGFVVLLVKEPIVDRDKYIMDIVENAVEANLCCIFDEFEKTHCNEASQKHLLSILDGVQSSSKYRRAYLLSSNSRKLEPNMIDRPGRLRYLMEFGNLSRSQVEKFADKFLTPECIVFKSDVIDYIMSRTVITIDITMEVINETNFLTESPKVWGIDFNAAQSNDPMHLSIYDKDTGEFIRDLTTRYLIRKEHDFDERMVRSLEVNAVKARLEAQGPFELEDQYENVMGQIVGVTDIGDILLCPTTHFNQTFFSNFPNYYPQRERFEGRCYSGQSKAAEIEYFGGVTAENIKELLARKSKPIDDPDSIDARVKINQIWDKIEETWDNCQDNDIALDGKPPRPFIVRIRQPTNKELGYFHTTFSGKTF